uniref:C2H2-type domain-containing protein n=1 Tax=Panagrolaimus superbus TaxID=310955 RepID=A0A914YDL3_9BILA
MTFSVFANGQRCLRKIFSELHKEGYNLYGAVNVVDLLYSRIGSFELNWNDPEEVDKILNENICKNHFKELLIEFESDRSGHARVNRFCKAHWSLILHKLGQTKPEPVEKIENEEEKVEPPGEEMADDVIDIPDPIDDEEYMPDQTLDSEIDRETIETVNKFGNLIDVQRIITQKTYNELSNVAKRLKVASGRKILHFFAAIMGPGSEEEFGSKICSIYQKKQQPEKQHVGVIIEAVAEQYQRAPDKITKQIILGPLAATCSFSEVKQKIPGLSYFFPDCMVILPYGGTSVIMSNGQKLDVAANMRMQSHMQIIRMFLKKMEEEGRTKVLPKSTMLAILNHCHAKKSKELTCVDYYLAAALDGFNELIKIVDYWLTIEEITVEESKKLKNGLKVGQEYLQTDFGMQLKKQNEVISHCIQHALNDPENDEFTTECEEHVTFCPKCESLTKLLNAMKHRIEKMVSYSDDDSTEEKYDMEFQEIEIHYAVFNILELRSHIVRSKISEMERANDLKELDETKAYITLDYAHKLLPTKYRETQKDFFGKEGMSNHITHVQTVEDGESAELSFVHIIQENKQDSTAVIAIILDVLKILKEKGITSVILRSDNAGCYHSKEIILSLAQLSEESGVKITKFSFSEPQNGKGNSDRISALVKNKVRRYVRTGKNVCDEYEFFDALVETPGISYATISVATVIRVEKQTIPTTALRGIASFYVFIPKENGILVHRAANIGKGKLFKYNKSNNKKLLKIPSLKKEKEKTFGKIINEDQWRSGKTRNKAKPAAEECEIFDCPNEGCDETFSSYGDYMRHIVFSGHGIVNPLNSERSVENTLTDETTPEKGWAHRKTKKLPEITKHATEYVRNKFNEGALDKAKKWKPKAVAAAMKVAKDENKKPLFKPNEILFAEQIQQLFSKFAALQKQPTKISTTKKRKACQEIESNLEKEGEDLESCVKIDQITRDNRQINVITRARRLEMANDIDASSQSVYEMST